jgi:hypothetical protein
MKCGSSFLIDGQIPHVVWQLSYHIDIMTIFLDYSFQYGPEIKLPLQILPSMHDQPYGMINPQWLLQVDQSDNFDTAFSRDFLKFCI